MTTYAHIAGGSVDSLVDLTPQEYAGMQANGKAARLRIWVPTAKPVPASTEAVDPGVAVVDAINATQVWVLRPKTAAEITADELATESATVAQLIADVKTQLDITNALFNPLTDPQKIAVLRDDRRLVLRAVRYLLRRQ